MIDPRTVPIRFSALKNIARSPAHYRHACQWSDAVQPLCMKLGSGTHALAFGTPAVSVYPGPVRRGKEYDAWLADQPPGAVILNAKEYAAAKGMADSLRSDPVVAPFLFSPGLTMETRIRWQIDGIDCAGTPDVFGSVGLSGPVVPDLKTARTAEPARFESQARWSGYIPQVCWYADGLEAAGYGWHAPMLIAVESSAPYPCVAWRLTAEAVEYGRRTYRGWLETLRVHLESNVWPGYAQTVRDMDAPEDTGEPFSLIGADGEEMQIQ